jgi:glucosamine kinase
MSTVLGVDAGGTKTLAALVDASGAVLDFTRSAGLDPTHAQNGEAELDDFLLGLVPADAVAPEAATIGLPFHGEIATITAMQQSRVNHRLGDGARACNDVEIAHIGAFLGGDGVLCLAGTGSMAWAKGPAGTARSGGFGDLFGDEGSAFWIGQRALALLSREMDNRRPKSAFGAGLIEALGISNTGVIDWVYAQANPRVAIASVAPHVSTLAAAGHADAAAILRDAAAELAATLRAAAHTAGLAAPTPLAIAGSAFRDSILRAELARLTGTDPIPGRLPPVGGAVLDAARRAGWAIDAAWVSKLASELKQGGAA